METIDFQSVSSISFDFRGSPQKKPVAYKQISSELLRNKDILRELFNEKVNQISEIQYEKIMKGSG